MRVISGKARGTRLTTMEGMNTRPTTDRIKESIFNLIQFDVPDARVLDLFAGSGALGIEAASRGAASVTFVERHRKCHKIIEENVKRCHLDNTRLIKGEVATGILGLGSFDLILMDPPYQKDFEIQTLQLILDQELLAEEGLIMIEHHKDTILPERLGTLVIEKTKNYGITGITLYRYDG